MKKKVIYYKDEHNDEFSSAKITPKKIDGGYKYIRNRFLSGFLYNIVARPLAYIYVKLKYAQKTVGRQKLKPYGKKGVFIYGNHTQAGGDPLIPNVFCYPKKVYFIVHPNNVSMPFFGGFMPYLGALPLPDNMAAYRNFLSATEQRIDEGASVVIYPEAHIWPYCSFIRSFPDKSFSYPCGIVIINSLGKCIDARMPFEDANSLHQLLSRFKSNIILLHKTRIRCW